MGALVRPSVRVDAVRRAGRAALAAWAVGVAGCAVAPAPAPVAVPAPVARPSADQRAAAPAALLAERKWLQSWFQGTPVRIAQREDGAVTVDVPRDFCFDAGRTVVKPPLAAVLDKVAESLRRVPSARLTLLAAPNDPTGTALAGPPRALQVQRYLLGRGVPAASLDKPTGTAEAAVQLRLEVAAP